MSAVSQGKDVSHVGAWIGVALAVLYIFLPVNILPKVMPVAGWLDELFVGLAAVLNLMQSYAEERNVRLASVLMVAKWFAIVLFVVIIDVALMVYVLNQFVTMSSFLKVLVCIGGVLVFLVKDLMILYFVIASNS
jgi:hypothetical protein